ncbi:hypothetical protein [Hydrogenivirga sp.]
MFVETCGVSADFGELRAEVSWEDVTEKAQELIEKIEKKFEEKVGHMSFGGE